MNTPGARDKIIESIRSSETILVTVNQHPSVDELSAALGLTMQLNEMGKHATAVVSGNIPPAINFLKPEKTFQNSVDSLRDFVIALDKEKADHLRYKVEGDVVKIFITPYRTVITESDFEYSQGDYNVEAVIALGVTSQKDLDKALESHGKILHDATVATIGLAGSSLGSIDWHSDGASSISEVVAQLLESMKGDEAIPERVASALLTGIVAATDRFSNDKTSSTAMTVAAKLMSYGANQQLIAARLQDNDPNFNNRTNKTTPQDSLKEGVSRKVEQDEKPDEDEAKSDLTVEHQEKPAQNAEVSETKPSDNKSDEQKLTDKLPALPTVAPATPVDKALDPFSFEPTPVSDLANELAKEASQSQPGPENELERLLSETKQVAKQSADNRLESSKIKLPLTAHAKDDDDPTLAQIDEQFRGMPRPAPSINPDASIVPPIPSLQIPELPPLDAPATTPLPVQPPKQDLLPVPDTATQSPASTIPVPIPTPPPPSIDLPSIPSTPDFSQMPPLPEAPDFSQFLDGTSPNNQSNAQSQQPMPTPPTPPTPADPGQFKIPGQS